MEQTIEHGSVTEHLPSQKYSPQAMDPSLLTTLLELDRRKTRMRRKCLEQNQRAICAILDDLGATTLLQSCGFADEDIRQMIDECIASQASAMIVSFRDDDTKFSAARTLSRAELEAIKKDICARLALVKEVLDRDCAEAPRVKSETSPRKRQEILGRWGGLRHFLYRNFFRHFFAHQCWLVIICFLIHNQRLFIKRI